MSEVAQITPVQQGPEAEIARVQAELMRRFAGSGCVARSRDFARLIVPLPSEEADEALYRLCDEGVAEMEYLSDGASVLYFPRR